MKKHATIIAKKIKSIPSRASDRLKAIYHRRPLKTPKTKTKIIAVVGDKCASLAAHYLANILKQHGKSVSLLTSDDTSSVLDESVEFRRFMSQAKRAKSDFVVLEITPDLAQYLSGRLAVHLAVLTCLLTPRTPTPDPLVQAQLQLFEHEPPLIVLNRDEPWFDRFDEFLAADLKLSYGTTESAKIRIKKAKMYKKGSEALITLDQNTDLELASYSTSEEAPESITAAATAAILLNIPPETIQDGIASYDPPTITKK